MQVVFWKESLNKVIKKKDCKRGNSWVDQTKQLLVQTEH